MAASSDRALQALSVASLLSDVGSCADVVVGGRLDADVRWVVSTELQDPATYLHRGSVVLTNGLWQALGTSPEVFVERLVRSEASAIGYGLDADGLVPRDLVAACEGADLTLFTVPHRVPFSAISDAFYEHLRRAERSEADAVNELNSELLQASTMGDSILSILDVLSRRHLLSVQLLGPGRRCQAREGHRLDDPIVQELWETVRADSGRHPFDAGDRSVFPIPLESGSAMHLVVSRNLAALTVEQRSAASQAVLFLGRELQYEAKLHQSEQRFHDELLGLILGGPQHMLAASLRLQALGIDSSAPVRAVEIRMAETDPSYWLISEQLRVRNVAHALTRRRDATVMIVQWDEHLDETEFADAVIGRGVVLGFGAVVECSQNLQFSIVTAQQAARRAEALHPNGGWESESSLTTHKNLLALLDDDVLKSFSDGLLGPLRDYDADHRSDLVATIEAFIASGCRWSETATTLYVHVNTLRYRIQRIEQLTGRDLSSMRDRVDFALALESSSKGTEQP